MELNAVTRSVGDIFSVNKKYLVPRFQREYSWTKEEVDEFWNDIVQQITVVEHTPKCEEYFIGCIVLVGEDSKQDYSIVDGQQRLTTLTILIRAIVERLKELKDESAAKALHSNYIEGTDNDGKKYFKLGNESPKPYFQNELQAYEKVGYTDPQTEEERLLTAAFDGFQKKLKEYSIKGLSDVDSIKALRDQVLGYLKFILVTAKQEDDAYTIFETLNARGLSLTSVDLIKNWIFKNDKSIHPHDNAKELWSKIRKEITSFSDLDVFFRHYWNSKYAYASNDRLYKSFNSVLKEKKIVSAKDFLLELVAAAKRYRKIGAPSEKDWTTQKQRTVVKNLELLNQYKVTQVRPFLLALFECREKKYVDETLFIKIIRDLENFHLIFSNICHDRASGLEGTYARAAKGLWVTDKAGKTDKAKVKETITDLHNSLKGKMPNVNRIADSIKQILLVNDNEASKKTIQTIFTKIEQYLQNTSELKIGSFSLEHIRDQSTGDSWVGSIGNLIPLDEKLNNGIPKNTSFKDKKRVYQKSELKIVKHFLAWKSTDEWTSSLAEEWLLEIGDLLHKATVL